ncbi:hypothetical protein TNCV_4841471 [Trichonephila clavipes]|uniref:Uncharacterized protein n=1 Tax=Trichonephila clavipes TaxID=2585209 RepID=A0A8X6WJ89_TRICX|nr:hypothetical protein TNCV_4841471 [Trichonephila clavipes]
MAPYASSQGRHVWFPHFRYGQRAMSSNHYTNAEFADIHFIYGLINGNERVSVRLFGKRYSTRRQPNHLTFARVHQNLAEHGSFRVTIEGTGWL